MSILSIPICGRQPSILFYVNEKESFRASACHASPSQYTVLELLETLDVSFLHKRVSLVHKL